MQTYTVFLSIAAILQSAKAAISPEYHSLVWKFGDANFWLPLGLNTTTFELESPAGAAPNSLNKRGHVETGTQYLPCTAVTLSEELSGSALEQRLEQYRALNDDVWSEEQVRTSQTLFEMLANPHKVHGVPLRPVDLKRFNRS